PWGNGTQITDLPFNGRALRRGQKAGESDFAPGIRQRRHVLLTAGFVSRRADPAPPALIAEQMVEAAGRLPIDDLVVLFDAGDADVHAGRPREEQDDRDVPVGRRRVRDAIEVRGERRRERAKRGNQRDGVALALQEYRARKGGPRDV